MPSESPILVVGAGPVGFVTALRLAQANVPVLLIEKERALQDDLRASTFHPPTLEMLDELDLTEGLLAQGLKGPTWQIRLHETHEKAEFDLSVLKEDTRYPFRLQVEQRVLCALAAEQVKDHPLINFRLGTELVDFTQDDDRVTARVRSHNGEETIATAFLVACDGSRSRVRSLLDLSFEGLTYPETTILVTTHFPFEEHLPGLSHVNYIWCDHGTFSLLKLPGIWRCSVYADVDQSDEDALHPDNIEAKLQMVVPRDAPYAIEEIRPYRIHQRIVDNYRHGRVLLAGDSAHLNSPSGGMGMNGGVHDAFNLTGRLPKVYRGEEGFETLDQYSRQRQPTAKEQILQQAHINRTRMQKRDPEWRRQELTRLQNITTDPAAMRDYLLKSSMIEGLRKAAEIT